MTETKLRGVIAAIATAVDDDGAPDCARATKLARYLLDNGCDGLNVLGTTGEATSFSLEQRKRVMTRLSRRRPAARPPDGRHRRGRGRRRGRADAARRRARLCRRAGAAAVLLQGRAGRRAGRLCRRHREGDARQSRSRSISITSRRSPACPGTSTLVRRLLDALRRPHRRPEGFLRRHGLCARGGGDLAELRGVPLDRSGAAGGARRRLRRLHLGDRQSQRRSLRARLARAAMPPRSTARSPSASCSTASRWSPA